MAAKSIEWYVFDVLSVMMRLKRRADCVWRIEKLPVDLEALRFGVDPRLGFDGEYVFFALNDEFNLGIPGVGRPVVGLYSVGGKFLKDKLLGKSAFEIREKGVAVEKHGGRRAGHRTKKPDIMHVEFEGGEVIEGAHLGERSNYLRIY